MNHDGIFNPTKSQSDFDRFFRIISTSLFCGVWFAFFFYFIFSYPYVKTYTGLTVLKHLFIYFISGAFIGGFLGLQDPPSLRNFF